MPQRLLAPELRHALRMRSQAPHFRGPGRAARLRLGRHPGPRGRQLRRAQADTGLFARLAKPHLLGPLGRLVKIHRAALPAAGVAQLAPATDLVSGAAILLGIDKAFGQHHRMPPGAFPVLAQPCKHQLHKPADQIRIMALLLDIQTRVVDHQRQAFAPLAFGPTDIMIPRLDMQGRRAPSRHRQPLALPDDGIAKLFPHQLGAVQVVVLDEDLIALLNLFRTDQQPDGHPQ